LNLPLAPGIAARAVAYASSDSGYIDDINRHRSDVNRTTVRGGRASLRVLPGDDWEIEVGGAVQDLSGHDGQYAFSHLPPLTRTENFAQPYDTDFAVADMVVRKRWSKTELISATGWVRHELTSHFDATGSAGTSEPQLFLEYIDINLISNETRISRSEPDGSGWLAGISLINNSAATRRKLGPPRSLTPITGVHNRVSETALFSQYNYPLTPHLLGTVGARLTYTRSVGRARPGNRACLTYFEMS